MSSGEVLVWASDKLDLLFHLDRIHVFCHVNTTAVEEKDQLVGDEKVGNENLDEQT